MIESLLIVSEQTPALEEVKKFFNLNSTKYKVARGPLTIESVLQKCSIKTVLWLNNENFSSLFGDIINVLNRFDVTINFYGFTDLDKTIIDQITAPHQLLFKLSDLLSNSKSNVNTSNVNDKKGGLTTKNQDIASFGNNLSEELNFRNILKSKTKQKNLIDTKSPQTSLVGIGDQLSSNERNLLVSKIISPKPTKGLKKWFSKKK